MAAPLLAQPLELWGSEATPACRGVREVLCGLELTYLLHNVAKGRPRRPAFAERSGQGRVPHLYDPNAEVARLGARRIAAHLEAAYAQ